MAQRWFAADQVRPVGIFRPDESERQLFDFRYLHFAPLALDQQFATSSRLVAAKQISKTNTAPTFVMTHVGLLYIATDNFIVKRLRFTIESCTYA